MKRAQNCTGFIFYTFPAIVHRIPWMDIDEQSQLQHLIEDNTDTLMSVLSTFSETVANVIDESTVKPV